MMTSKMVSDDGTPPALLVSYHPTMRYGGGGGRGSDWDWSVVYHRHIYPTVVAAVHLFAYIVASAFLATYMYFYFVFEYLPGTPIERRRCQSSHETLHLFQSLSTVTPSP